MKDIEPKQVNMLRSVSNFIKDHGVAIFLVVFFVVFIYPEQAKERKQWITQITELQNSLDPNKRSMSAAQATIILDLVTDSFFQSIESNVQTELSARETALLSFGTSASYSGDSFRLTIFGEEFRINSTRPLDEQVKKAEKKFRRLTLRREELLRQEVSIALDKAVRSASSTTAGLRSFVYADGTLADIWETAFSDLYGEFSELLIFSYAMTAHSDFNRSTFADFIEDAGGEVSPDLHKISKPMTPSLVIFKYRKKVRETWAKAILAGSQKADKLY